MITSRRGSLRPIAALVLLAAFPALSGCSNYGPVSRRTYDLALALYSICNQKDSAKLNAIESQISAAKTNADLSTQEVEWLESILSDAQSGDWPAAAKACRAILEAQVLPN